MDSVFWIVHAELDGFMGGWSTARVPEYNRWLLFCLVWKLQPFLRDRHMLSS